MTSRTRSSKVELRHENDSRIRQNCMYIYKWFGTLVPNVMHLVEQWRATISTSRLSVAPKRRGIDRRWLLRKRIVSKRGRCLALYRGVKIDSIKEGLSALNTCNKYTTHRHTEGCVGGKGLRYILTIFKKRDPKGVRGKKRCGCSRICADV